MNEVVYTKPNIERTTRNGSGLERVSLNLEELGDVQSSVMDHNVAVIQECLERADVEFPEQEPNRRLRIALLLAEKAAVDVLTAEKEALDTKVADIKDAARAKGMGRNGPGPNPSREHCEDAAERQFLDRRKNNER